MRVSIPLEYFMPIDSYHCTILSLIVLKSTWISWCVLSRRAECMPWHVQTGLEWDTMMLYWMLPVSSRTSFPSTLGHQRNLRLSLVLSPRDWDATPPAPLSQFFPTELRVLKNWRSITLSKKRACNLMNNVEVKRSNHSWDCNPDFLVRTYRVPNLSRSLNHFPKLPQ